MMQALTFIALLLSLLVKSKWSKLSEELYPLSLTVNALQALPLQDACAICGAAPNTSVVHDPALIRSELEKAGFPSVAVETRAEQSRASSPRCRQAGGCNPPRRVQDREQPRKRRSCCQNSGTRESGQLSPGTDALWVSEVGTMLESGALARRIWKHTKEAFGASLPPHWFRDAAATSIAIENPRHVCDAHHILGNTLAMTEKHYNQARSLEASRRYNAMLTSLRGTLNGRGEETR
jgi:hypothetical protein